MDTMKVLLGATLGLLLALVVLAFTKLPGEKSTELELLRMENARLRAQAEAPAAAPLPAPLPVQPAAETKIPEETARELEAMRSKLAAIEAEKRAEAEAAAAALENPEPAATAEEEPVTKSQQRRARLIENAILIGQVESFDPDWNSVAFRVIRDDLIQRGLQLGIRRNSGIRGQIKITDLEPGTGAGEPILGTFFNGIDVQPGDELIIPPL